MFAPLGAKLGGKRLVAMAERFGFNQPPTIPGAAESTIPSASTIGDDLAVGSSAIGQGKVQATALEMTDVAATIAMGGRRPLPTLQAHQPPRFVHVTSRHVAGLVQQMMVAVVQFGTGTSAAIPGVTVAGKTGTAELAEHRHRHRRECANADQQTDAWFVGYAPVGAPRIVVGGAVPQPGRRRRDRGAGGARGADRRPRGPLTAAHARGAERRPPARADTRPGGRARSSPALAAARAGDVEGQRPVGVHRGRQLEQQQAALRGPEARGRVRRRLDPEGRSICWVHA